MKYQVSDSGLMKSCTFPALCLTLNKYSLCDCGDNRPGIAGRYLELRLCYDYENWDEEGAPALASTCRPATGPESRNIGN